VVRRYNVSRATIRKWENREDVQDRSHHPYTIATSLLPAQEAGGHRQGNPPPPAVRGGLANAYPEFHETRDTSDSSHYLFLKRYKALFLWRLAREAKVRGEGG
jgi:hypothetical protein